MSSELYANGAGEASEPVPFPGTIPGTVPGTIPGTGDPEPVHAGGGIPYAPAARGAAPGLGFLLDVHLSVSVEVGRVTLPLRQVMDLGPGSVVELQHNASEPVEIHANGRCIGRGEIVVVGEQFGVRVTELGASA